MNIVRLLASTGISVALVSSEDEEVDLELKKKTKGHRHHRP